MAPFHDRLFIAAVCFVAFALASVALAHPGQGRRQDAPMYDTKTEARWTGSVVAVEHVSRPGRRGLGGTHLMLKTATDMLEVHLGPTAYLTKSNIEIVKGDEVEIFGSRITIDDEPVVLAREVKKGSNVWVLRDASGRPMWSGSRR